MKALLFAVVISMLGACATTENLSVSEDTLAAMDGRSLVVIQRESPDFVAMTSGKGMFAVAGVGAAVSAGNKLVKENGIADPALEISRELADGLADQYGMSVRSETPRAESGGVDTLTKLAHGHDYALDVTTHGWSYIYDGFKFGNYYVGYSSKLRLIEVRTGAVVSSGLCTYDAKKAGKTAVSHDELLANNAAYIKRELSDARQTCVQQFSSTLFPTETRSVAAVE